MTKTKDETPDYVAIYDDASFDCPIPEYAHAAGIAAVAAAAKAEAAFTATEFLVDVVRGVEAERDAAYMPAWCRGRQCLPARMLRHKQLRNPSLLPLKCP